MIDEKFIQDGVKELRDGFQGFIAKGRAIQAMVQSRPGGSKTSVQLRGATVSDVAGLAAEASEYVSGRAAVIVQNFVGRATNFPPKIEARVLEESKEQQEKQRRLFQFYSGVHNVLNDYTQETAQGTSWDRMILEHIAVFGKVIGQPHAGGRSLGGQVTFRAPLFDPLTCYHDFDSFPRRFVREFMAGAADAKRLLAGFEQDLVEKRNGFSPSAEVLREIKEAEGKAVTVSDVWVEEPRPGLGDDASYIVHHAILVNDKLAGLFVTAFEHMPIVIIAIHAAPGSGIDFRAGGVSGQQYGSTRGVGADHILYHAQPFLAPIYYIHVQHQQFMSVLMEQLLNVMNPGKEVIIQPGSQETPPTAAQMGPGSVFVHGPDLGLQLQPVAMAQVEAAVRVHKEEAEGAYNRLYNEVNFGYSSPGDAGYLLVNKISAAATTVGESIRGASAFAKRIFDELTYQYIRGDLKFTVRGWKSHGKGAPQFFPGGDFSKKDLPKQYVLNVEFLADLPTNDAAKMDLYLRGEGKGFSKRQGRENTLDDPDPDLTQRLIDQDEYEATPAVKARRFLYRARQEAQALFDAAQKEKDPMARSAMLREAMIAQAEYEAQSLQMLGEVANRYGQLKAEAGPDSRFLPPEEAVGENPDLNAQAQGRVSSYRGGRPPKQLEAGSMEERT